MFVFERDLLFLHYKILREKNVFSGELRKNQSLCEFQTIFGFNGFDGES